MNDIYQKLVDLYAGGELPAELEQTLEAEAMGNKDLAYDMHTMRATVENLRASDDVEFTEESYQRILMRLYARGVDAQPMSPAPAHLQYYLPIQG
jgi:hypothetical protein